MVKVNNVNLYYESWGKGKPLVFVNAFSTRHSCYLTLSENYIKTHQVILFDNRGCGQSDCPDVPYSIEMMADDLAELCRTLQLPPCYFFGSSMGGTIIQMLAYKYPELMHSAILCNSFMTLDIRFALCAKAQLSLMQAGAPRTALTQDILGWIFSSTYLEKPGIIDSLIEMCSADPYPISEIGYRNQLHALLSFNSRPWISQIKAPTLVLGSDRDIIISEEHMKEMAGLIPKARYYNFEGAGHVPFLEQPERFHEVLSPFIS